jgi:hypothetical protein
VRTENARKFMTAVVNRVPPTRPAHRRRAG